MTTTGIEMKPPIAQAPYQRSPHGGMRDPSLVLHINPSQAGYLKKESDGDPPRERDVDPIAYARDLSGKGNHAVQNTTAEKPLWTGRGMWFNGEDDVLNADLSIDFLDDWTATAWVRQNEVSWQSAVNHGYPYIIADRGLNGASRGFFAYETESSYSYNSYPFPNVTGMEPISDFTLMCVSKCGNNASIYGNGALIATFSTADAVSDPIDGKIGSGSRTWHGDIGEVMMFTRALSAAEIAAYYQATRGEYDV